MTPSQRAPMDGWNSVKPIQPIPTWYCTDVRVQAVAAKIIQDLRHHILLTRNTTMATIIIKYLARGGKIWQRTGNSAAPAIRAIFPIQHKVLPRIVSSSFSGRIWLLGMKTLTEVPALTGR